MGCEIISRAPSEFSDCDLADARQYMGLCGDEPVGMFLDAAVDYVEKKSQRAFTQMTVVFTTQGGRVHPPFCPVAKVTKVSLVSSHGVHMTHPCDDILCLPDVSCDCAHYEITYKTACAELSALEKVAVFAVAKAIYDGVEIPDISTYVKMPNALEKFIQGVGGLNVKVK